jgi:hypothetical protein
MNYSEDPKTLNLYPEVAFEEDLTPDDIGEDIVEKCNAIQKACKGEIRSITCRYCDWNLPIFVLLFFLPCQK